MDQIGTEVLSGVPLPGSSSSRFTRHLGVPPKLSQAKFFCVVGFIGGSLGGLLGIGGGSAIAPLLLITGRLRPSEVSGTTLTTVLFISIVGSVAYASLGHVRLDLAWPIAMGSVAGSVLGALSAKRLSMRLMLALFLAILPYFAAKELWPSLSAPAISTNLVPLVTLGFATGFMSGLLGISGASLIVPSLVGFFLIDHHAAQGIAISVAMADSMAGAATHMRKGNVNYRMLIYLVPPAIIGALGGALLSDSVSGPVLRKLFAFFMVAIWVTLLGSFIKSHLRTPARSLGP